MVDIASCELTVRRGKHTICRFFSERVPMAVTSTVCTGLLYRVTSPTNTLRLMEILQGYNDYNGDILKCTQKGMVL